MTFLWHPAHMLCPCYIASGAQVAVEHMFTSGDGLSGETRFGLFGEIPFRSIQGRRVFYVDQGSGRLEKDSDGLPKISTARISSMLMPTGEIANMATMVFEAVREHGGIELVLGTEVVVPEAEEVPGVDLEAISMPPTPPTPDRFLL